MIMHRYRWWIAACLSLMTHAADPVLLATMGNKASLSLGDKPLTLSVGETRQGIKLISVMPDSAVVETAGKRRNVRLGQAFFAPSGGGDAASAGVSVATLYAVDGGHFLAQIAAHGGAVRGIVDTGASFLSVSSRHAVVLGIRADRSRPVQMHTAQGLSVAWQTTVDELKLEGITLYNVEAVVHDGAYPELPLIGMSVLNQLNMQRDGDHMTLKKKF